IAGAEPLVNVIGNNLDFHLATTTSTNVRHTGIIGIAAPAPPGLYQVLKFIRGQKFNRDCIPRIISMKKTHNTLLFFLASSSALADGNTLLEECGEIIRFAETGYLDESSVGASFCMGMVNGMMAMNTIYRSQRDSKPLFCPPDSTITNAEGAR